MRLSLVDLINGAVAAGVQSDNGIKSIYDDWQKNHPAIDRTDFFRKALLFSVEQLEIKTGITLGGMPIYLSGMASSSIGMKNLAYASLPFHLNGSSAEMERIEKTEWFPHEIRLISGVSRLYDVMRGEELQAIGWYSLFGEPRDEMILMLPGTHSKHLYIQEGQLLDFETFLTGEMYDVLRKHSILQHSVSSDPFDWDAATEKSFKNGVEDGFRKNLLHQVFTIRAKDVLGVGNPPSSSAYLSGLLIGNEFSSLAGKKEKIVIAAENKLYLPYKLAVEAITADFNVELVEPAVVSQLSIAGHLKLHNNF